jgi:hypothetical protein
MQQEDGFFDAGKAIAELLEGQPLRSGQRLPFHEKCAAFYALQMGVSPRVVMQAFGINAATASHLKHASERRRGRQAHYPDVAREYERLGERPFRDRYYNDDVHTRLMRIKYDVAQPGDQRGPRGPSIRANKFSFENYGAFPTKLGPYRIDWMELHGLEGKQYAGWWFIPCNPDTNGDRMEGADYQGAETLKEGNPRDEPPRSYRFPFRTSAAAYNGCLIWSQDRPWPK